jgi:hypothetical protein
MGDFMFIPFLSDPLGVVRDQLSRVRRWRAADRWPPIPDSCFKSGYRYGEWMAIHQQVESCSIAGWRRVRLELALPSGAGSLARLIVEIALVVKGGIRLAVWNGR